MPPITSGTRFPLAEIGQREQPARQPVALGPAPVPGHTERDRPALDWPDAAEMVAERVVGHVPAGKDTDAPIAEHIRFHKPLGNPRRFLRRDDAGGEQMSGIGRDRANLLLIRSEPERVESRILHPEGWIEASLQLPR